MISNTEEELAVKIIDAVKQIRINQMLPAMTSEEEQITKGIWLPIGKAIIDHFVEKVELTFSNGLIVESVANGNQTRNVTGTISGGIQ